VHFIYQFWCAIQEFASYYVPTEFISEWAKVEEDCRRAIQLDSQSVKVSGCLDLPSTILCVFLFKADYACIQNY
jgi:hypothetical protein